MTAWPTAGRTVVEWTPREGLPVVEDWLSAEEVSRWHRQIAPSGLRWAAARCWVRARLAVRLGCDPRSVPISVDAQGRPRLDGALRSGDLNISHTDSVLVLAVSAERVGVDVEEPPPVDEDLLVLARVVATPAELEQLRAVEPAGRASAFQRWWVRKEAVLKADGSGFLRDPRLVHVGVTQVQAPEPWVVTDLGELRDASSTLAWPRTLLATASPRPVPVDPPQVVRSGHRTPPVC
ncbi:4'-phosphopantetheinyl transferase family protein [Ornithinimicrobium cavernae]|uniref:4'-phosphopantetheinyl transferase family protein n=1 Tax=Ornithinimicrobium cavernae TaxID=2666047 RepID=UPI000D68C126|nr:4'-phosphopantetheinyl transferase superfamily protein [Ornithinimicrobium cavernae]